MAKIRLKFGIVMGFGEMRLICGRFCGVSRFYESGLVGLWNDFTGSKYVRIKETYKRRLKRPVV